MCDDPCDPLKIIQKISPDVANESNQFRAQHTSATTAAAIIAIAVVTVAAAVAVSIVVVVTVVYLRVSLKHLFLLRISIFKP